jgi:hypothetical protein
MRVFTGSSYKFFRYIAAPRFSNQPVKYLPFTCQANEIETAYLMSDENKYNKYDRTVRMSRFPVQLGKRDDACKRGYGGSTPQFIPTKEGTYVEIPGSFVCMP